jgi:hypothetical protein
MKISRSYRLLRLYTWLEGVKCVSMAQAESEFHVGTRTIQRDIADIRAFLAEEKMQKGCDRTVLFDVVKGGYVLWQQ